MEHIFDRYDTLPTKTQSLMKIHFPREKVRHGARMLKGRFNASMMGGSPLYDGAQVIEDYALEDLGSRVFLVHSAIQRLGETDSSIESTYLADIIHSAGKEEAPYHPSLLVAPSVFLPGLLSPRPILTGDMPAKYDFFANLRISLESLLQGAGKVDMDFRNFHAKHMIEQGGPWGQLAIVIGSRSENLRVKYACLTALNEAKF